MRGISRRWRQAALPAVAAILLAWQSAGAAGLLCRGPYVLLVLGQCGERGAILSAFHQAGLAIGSRDQPDDLGDARTLVVVVGGFRGPEEAERDCERLKGILLAAGKRGIAVVGIYAGGMEGRGAAQVCLASLLPHCLLVVTTSDGDRDGFFSDAAQRLHIGLLLLSRITDLAAMLPRYFQP